MRNIDELIRHQFNFFKLYTLDITSTWSNEYIELGKQNVEIDITTVR